MCYLLMNIYKFLIKDANWHALPIDEYLQNFQLKMLIKDYIATSKYILMKSSCPLYRGKFQYKTAIASQKWCPL